MGDTRFAEPYLRVKDAHDPRAALAGLSDEETIAALAGASQGGDAFLSNILATEAQNRTRKATSVAEHIPEGALVIDAEGRIAYANRAAERLLGCSREELVGRAGADVMGTPALRSRVTDALARPTAGRERGLVVRYSSAPIDGRLGSTVVAFHDAGDAEARQRARDLAVSALDALPDAAIIVDREGNVTWSSPAVRPLYGYEPDEIDGKPLTLLWNEPDAWERVLASARRGNVLRDVEVRGRRKDARTVRVRVDVAPVTADGHVTSIVTLHHAPASDPRDVSLEAALDDAPVMLAAIEPTGKVTLWNRAAEHLTGYTRLQMASDPEALARLIPDEKARNQLTSSDLHSLDWTVDLLTRNGGTRTLRWYRGGGSGWAVGVDVTSQKMAEAEAARAASDLQQFLYSASHDLKEPLRMITSYLDLIHRRYHGRLDADGDDFIAFALDGAARLNELLDGLLGYSRVVTRGKPLARADSGLCLKQAAADLALSIREAGAVITTTELPLVLADTAQLTQLFQNLVSNAIKFRGDEPPRIHVSAIRNGSDWEFAVRDNGIGIDPKDKARIFLPFERLHSRDEYPGSGIGLAICARIAERHGGRIWVESEPGKGATFRFTTKAVE